MHARPFLITTAFAAVPVLTVCVFTPLTIYAGNSEEFAIAFPRLVMAYLPYALATALVLGLPGALLRGRALDRYHALLGAFAVLAWAQGNLLVWRYGELAGQSIAWSDGAWRGILDAAIWIGVLVVAIRYYKKAVKLLSFAGVAVLAIQCAAAVAIWATAGDEISQDSIAVASAEDSAKAFDFSARRNIVHIVMDGFQTDILQDILNSPQGAAFASELSGFTLYENNLGVYPYTQLTIPALLSGKVYRNEIPVDTFIASAMTGPTILGAAMDAGFEVDIAAGTGLANAYARAPHTNVYAITPADQADPRTATVIEAARLLDLALFRSVPHFAKALVHRDELWLFQANVRSLDHRHLHFFSNIAFLERMAASMTATRDRPVYKVLHPLLVHKPTVGTADCEYDGRKPTNRETVTAQATCALTTVLAVLRRMKALGIFDDSLIVLMADHGAWVPVENLRMPDDSESRVSAMIVAMATPALMIKPPGADQPLDVSGAPTSIADLPASLSEMLDLRVDFPGRPISSLTPGEQRTRTHLIYGYGRNDDAPGYLFPMTEFAVDGDPLDARNWRKVALHER